MTKKKFKNLKKSKTLHLHKGDARWQGTKFKFLAKSIGMSPRICIKDYFSITVVVNLTNVL